MLAGNLVGGMASEGARRLARGERPKMRDLMLTPANATRLADRLANLRGAAMKLGQMISMDAGDVLPTELAAILARLRDQAQHMPPAQLQKVLATEWGDGWRKRFRRFDARPIAAASIGQVHRALTRDGRDLAIKVQYPGVARSIESDVDNVATLLRVAGVLPRELDIAPLLAAAKEQLREEADYTREARMLTHYAELVEGHSAVLVPGLASDFCTANVLAMDYVAASPIEDLETATQEERDGAMSVLIELVLDELFRFGFMQTDPNFANYRWQAKSKRLVLLDFGAVRAVPAEMQRPYAKVLRAALADDPQAMKQAALEAGFIGQTVIDRHGPLVDRMVEIIAQQGARLDSFDFGDRAFVSTLRDEGMVMAQDRSSWHLPPPEMLFLQRKISGTALLAARLKARVAIRPMVEAALKRWETDGPAVPAIG